MRIAIIAEIDRENEFPHEFSPIRYHHVGYWLQELSKRHEVAIVDWRDLDEGFNAKEYVIQGEQRPQIIREEKNLEDLGDVILIRQSGPMHSQKRGTEKFKFSEESYKQFLTSIKQFSRPVINDPEMLMLAISKEYLLTLEKNGLPVIPSLIVTKPISIDALKEHLIALHSCREVVVKPKLFSGYGAGVRKLSSFSNDNEFKEYFEKFNPLIAQPVLESIYVEGEFSLIFLGEQVSHAVNKITGSFLINQDFNPTYSQFEPSEEMIETARQVKKMIEQEYHCSMDGIMRFDFIKKDGIFLLNEIEMINPGLYIRDLNMYPEFLEKLEKYLVSVKEKFDSKFIEQELR
ncbi:MAG: hypothetical protein KC535_03715 [Nanoarchaeota archaeon]|nr:hypothetical protein [Nanoarchaeota archaeon]